MAVPLKGFTKTAKESDNVTVFLRELGETSREGVDESAGVLKSAAKNLTGSSAILGGSYVGATYFDTKAQRDAADAQKTAAEEYQEAVENIQNDDNLSPEQKADALAELSEVFDDLVGDGSGGGGSGGLGIIGWTIVGLIALFAIKQGTKIWVNR